MMNHLAEPEPTGSSAVLQDDILSPRRMAELLSHPRYGDAAQAAAALLAEEYRVNRLMNRVFNDRGHFVIALFAHYLHHFPLDEHSDAGLTAGRLRVLCAETGISSAGRASATLSIMRFAGYLRATHDEEDRRRTLLVPTERLIALRRQRWARHFQAMTIIMPEGRQALDLWDRPWFDVAFLRAMVEGYRNGFRLISLVPKLEPYFEQAGGTITLLQLLAAAGAGPSPGLAPLTISDLASRFWISRAQVRQVLNCAAADGFIERGTGSRDPIIVLPQLTDVMNRFFAAGFLYCAHCIRAAIASAPDEDGHMIDRIV
jgi:DNA-binding MarR family transcriptional regulator